MTTTTHPIHHPKPSWTRATRIGGAALAAALLPVIAGLTLLASARVRRLAATLAHPGGHIAPARVGKLWGAGLLIIGALQALGSLAIGLAITDPAAVLLRTLFSLAGEGLLLVLSTRIAPKPHSGGVKHLLRCIHWPAHPGAPARSMH